MVRKRLLQLEGTNWGNEVCQIKNIMTLYTADVMDVAKKVTKGKKAAEEPKGGAIREPKVRTEKQIAAAAKAAETRKLKKEAAEAEAAEIAELRAKVAAKEEEIAVAVAAKKGKKKVAPVPVMTEDEVDEAVEEAVEEAPPKKKQRKQKKVEEAPQQSDVPPAWVEHLVKTVLDEKQKMSGEKKGQKKMREEAKQEAQEAWQDPNTRKQIVSARDQAFEKMYRQIFA